MKGKMNRRAIWKAEQAARLLAQAARLMREAVDLSDDCIASGRYDFLSWAVAIEEILSSDDGEAGIRPTLAMMTSKNQ